MKWVVKAVLFSLLMGSMAAFGQGPELSAGPVVDLCEGVGACSRPWITSGNANWLFTTAVSHDGWNSLQSGDVYDNQSSTLQTIVTGPASVSFWWKVSSETNWDTLSFLVNGAPNQQISGDVNWTKVTVPLGAGPNLLTWTYVKDSGLSIGDDAGWIDQFLVIESALPTGSVVVNSNQSHTSTPNVVLSLSYDDGDGSGVSGMRFSNNGSTWSSWEKPAATKAWTLSAGDGVKTVRAQFRDKAGNVSMTYSDAITVDATPPAGTIVIDNGNATTGSPTVGLTMTWDDGMGSGVTRMRFSNDGATWSPWEPVLDSKLWTLGGVMPGNYTVRVQFRDRMGNVSDRHSDYIRLAP